MWSKTPRQSIFSTVNPTPGPGAYNPKDAKKNSNHAVAFSKQPERFKRDDSSLSTCSNSTASSIRSYSQSARTGKLQERLRTFEIQIRERDQIISRLQMDKLTTLSRYQVLVDAYKQLRRVSVQSIPAQKLPKDISQEIMKILQDEKQQMKDEARPSMNEKDITDQMATFIVEMEQTDDPRLTLLENENTSLEVTLQESKNRIEQLEQEKQDIKKEVEQAMFEIGQLTGSLRASEAKDSEIKSLTLQLQRSNSLIDSMNSNVSTKDEKLFATIRELGDAKATLASFESTIAQQNAKLDERQVEYDRTIVGLKASIESKENAVKELEQKLSQLTTLLRTSQDERERLAHELSSTLETLEKIVQENGDLSLKSNSVEEELGELRDKSRKRKAQLLEAEKQLLNERTKSEELKNKLRTSQEELYELRLTLRDTQQSAADEKQHLQSQLQQSQDNFERQLDEARRLHDLLASQKAEVETELKLAVNRMRTLENQVQKRDELLTKVQEENVSLQKTLAETTSRNEDLSEQLCEKNDDLLKIRSQLQLAHSMESETKSELDGLGAHLKEIQALNIKKQEEITSLRSEYAALENVNLNLRESLATTVNETKAEHEKLRALENETSSMKLLNLAITAELEQTKTALEAALSASSEVDALKLELAQLEADKARLTASVKSLEEQVESWVRVRDSLSKQLQESEEKLKQTQECHASQMNLRENNIIMLEDHLKVLKDAHEDELNTLRKNFENDKEQISQSSAAHLREIKDKFSAEKAAVSATLQNLKLENEMLKSETDSLMNSKASFSLQLQAKEAEVLHLRSRAAEADFYEAKCLEHENASQQIRETITILQEDIQITRQELVDVQQTLEHEKRANEAHAIFTLAVINSNLGGQKLETLQMENENLRNQLSSLNELLDTLETGIETSEAKNSVYVKSYAQMQQQIQRLVGHSNNKQRIQYVGKLQTENRELKEEQAKLRAKVDVMQKKITMMDGQLRKFKEKENRPDVLTSTSLSTTQSRFF